MRSGSAKLEESHNDDGKKEPLRYRRIQGFRSPLANLTTMQKCQILAPAAYKLLVVPPKPPGRAAKLSQVNITLICTGMILETTSRHGQTLDHGHMEKCFQWQGQGSVVPDDYIFNYYFCRQHRSTAVPAQCRAFLTTLKAIWSLSARVLIDTDQVQPFISRDLAMYETPTCCCSLM